MIGICSPTNAQVSTHVKARARGGVERSAALVVGIARLYKASLEFLELLGESNETMEEGHRMASEVRPAGKRQLQKESSKRRRRAMKTANSVTHVKGWGGIRTGNEEGDSKSVQSKRLKLLQFQTSLLYGGVD